MYLPQSADFSCMAILTDDDPSKSTQAPLDTSAAAEEAAAIAEDAAKDLEKVEKLMGRQHMALYGFIGVFLAVLASAIAYLAGRQGPNPAASIPTKPVTVISSAAPVPAPAPAPVLPKAPPAAAAPVTPTTAAAVVPVPVVSQPSKPVPVVPAPTPAAGALADVLPNRLYLQVGSLDKNVAELLTQGLRTKGVPATVAPGVNDVVARIIVGPFDTASEMGVVQKQLTEMGFSPFPRQFQPGELRPSAQNAAAVVPVNATPAGKNIPVVKR